jgi:hypothetical protein
MFENDQVLHGLGWGYICQQIAVAAFALLSLQAGASAEAAPDPLAGISIQPEYDDGTYQRVHWMPGGAWIDADNDCQDGRQEILIAQSTIKPVLTNDGCSVISGRWVDPYTGETTTDPSKLQRST